ncbi:hypothetical protein C4J81_00405 [Deltaproteobacteria bacterium Smac51]|nr:hypothetical protein C4J81_00405 [Deltaproteobacteria bacterium Smac51]
MATIKLLPEKLINTIAAGEVVERPSAVLKELLENSLDAGADRIEIDIHMGGKKLIRISDNGKGMDRDDILMSLERHATSKINKDADLVHINTLGFRGEALPSIGAVSQLTITSATAKGEGHKVQMTGGVLQYREKAPCNPGTTVEVADLFRNVPARRKFLKSNQTESAHLLDIAQRYALSREGLRLVYRDNNREVLSVDSHHDFRTRVYRVMGRETAASLTPFERIQDNLKIYGWLGAPETAANTSSGLYLYVLGRPVKDRLLTRAITSGYGRLLTKGRYPAAIIFVEPAPEDVDVNVHPAKAEVRFRESNVVFTLLAEAVSQTIGYTTFGQAIQPPARPRYEETAAGQTGRTQAPETARTQPPSPAPGAAEEYNVPPWMADEQIRPEANQEVKTYSMPIFEAASAPPRSPDPGMDDESSTEEERQEPSGIVAGYFLAPRIGQAPNFNDGLLAIGQLNDSYILAQGNDGLYIIDQHAAHERVIYNQLKTRLEANGLQGQSIMFPETRDLPPHQALAAEKLSYHLEKLGFDLVHMGGQSFTLKGAPALLGQADPWATLTEILSTSQGRLKALDGAGVVEGLTSLANSWLYSIACRAAIKAGKKMSQLEMSQLLVDMARTPNGAYCPHGRPAIHRYSIEEIEKKFHR